MDMTKFDTSRYTKNKEAETKFNDIVAGFPWPVSYFIKKELIIILSRAYDKFQDHASQTLDTNITFQWALEAIKAHERDINDHTCDELLAVLGIFDTVKKELKIESMDEILFEAALAGSGKIGSSYHPPRTEEDRKEEKLRKLQYL